MITINDWMKNLVIYLILSGILLNLTPNDNYKRYVSFFIGLVIIIMMAKPLTYVFRFGAIDIEKIINDIEYGMSSSGSVVEEKTTSNYYELGVSGGIKENLINNNLRVCSVSVITDKSGEILKCYVYIDDSLDEGEIKKVINDVYYVDWDNIYIVRR